MTQEPESSPLVTLCDPHFSLKDGFRITPSTVDQINVSKDVSQESESFISPRSISRLLVERGEYSAVPICFQHFSKAATGWSEWVNSELESKSKKTIVETGLAVPLLLSGFCEIFKDDICLRHVVRRWSPQTHTFVCSWGEFTPTLEDVYNIMRLPITGDTDPFDLTLDESLEKKLKILQEGTGSSRGKFEFSNWIKYFWGSTEGDVFKSGKGFRSSCRLEAMFAYWLSKYIFTDFPCGTVQQRVLPLAIVLGTGARLPLAPLFLGRLYRMLDFISNDEKEGAGCYGITSSTCITFLQVFIWERFKGSVVEPVTPEFLHKLERGRRSHSIVEFPLCCKWFRRRANKDAFKPAVLDDVDKFIFRPYSSISGFEEFHFYYPEDQSWACPGLTAMFLTATLRHIPTYGDRFEPLVVRYSPHRVRRQFGINQDVPVGGFVCRAAKAVIVSFIKHDGNSRKGMFSNCLGTKDSVGVPTPEYNKFWEFQLHKFDKFIGTGGTVLRCPESASKNKRLIPRKTLMGKMSKLNLSYVEVYSNGTERVVGDPGKSASQNSSGVTNTRVRNGNSSGSRKFIRTSKDGEKKDNMRVHHFKSKTSTDHITFTSASGVRMLMPPNALPLKKGMKEKEKGAKRKFVSGSKASCGPSDRKAKRKAIMRDPLVGRKQSSSDDSYNESERCDSSAYEEEFNETDHEGIQEVQSDEDIAGLEIQSDENSARLEVQSGTGSEIQSGGAGLEVQSDEGGAGLEVQSEGAGLEVQFDEGIVGLEVQSRGAGLEVQSRGAGLEVQSRGAGLEVQSEGAGLEVQSEGARLEVQSDGMEMNFPIEPSQDHYPSFTHGFASFRGRPGEFSLSPAVMSQEVDNSVSESVIGEVSEENLGNNVASPLAGGSWEVRFHNFMTEFESTGRSSITFDDIAPSLSGSQSLFEGRKIPSEFVLPLTSFAAEYGGGSLASLFKEDNSPHQRHILTKEFGYVLFSMEHEVETEESFLVWRDMCRDMMNWGFKLEFMLDHLRMAARNFFGYMLRPVGSENCCTEVCRLEGAVLELKKKLSNLEGQLENAKEDLHFKLGGVVSSDTLVCILKSSWTSQSRAIHGLY